MNHTYKPGDVLDLKIERIVPRGLGIGHAEGLTVFVPLVVAGDTVRVRLNEIKKRVAFGSAVDVISPSANRIDPPCPYFGTCGGCDFQQMDYSAQLGAKSAMIRDCLHRIGKIDVEIVDIVASPQPFAYRSRARWHIDRKAKSIGYFRRDSHEVVDIESCPILTPGTQAALDDIRKNVNWEMMFADRVEVDAASDGNQFSLFSRDMVEATRELTTEAAAVSYAYSARSFFQANQFLLNDLIDLAIGRSSGRLAFDLYCGVGLFALPLARQFERVVGVEEDPTAIDFARRNARTASLSNIALHALCVKAFLRDERKELPDFVLIDPPRIGAEKGVIERIAALRPREISYVSCEPSILARDLRILLDSGYEIKQLTGLDLFPQTHHVETVVRLVRGK